MMQNQSQEAVSSWEKISGCDRVQGVGMNAQIGILWVVGCLPFALAAQTTPSGAAIDAEVGKIMAHTRAQGMAVAVVDHGRIDYVTSYGFRKSKGDLLTKDTVMYGASLTKTLFAYTVMQLVDQGKLNLDTPIEADLDKPLPGYDPDPIFPDKYGP
jgi:CubicO group peptidase (beta-lactamase class C family)